MCQSVARKGGAEGIVSGGKMRGGRCWMDALVLPPFLPLQPPTEKEAPLSIAQ